MSDVVELFPGVEQTDRTAPVTTREKEHRCFHRHTELDEDARRVYCRDCGEEVAAFDVLSRLAKEWNRIVDARKHAARQRRQVEADLAELKRQERNAKARRDRALTRGQANQVVAIAAEIRARQPGCVDKLLDLADEITRTGEESE